MLTDLPENGRRLTARMTSASGQKQTSGISSATSAYPSITDIERKSPGVRYVP
jgi:hypothetical protein